MKCNKCETELTEREITRSHSAGNSSDVVVYTCRKCLLGTLKIAAHRQGFDLGV